MKEHIQIEGSEVFFAFFFAFFFLWGIVCGIFVLVVLFPFCLPWKQEKVSIELQARITTPEVHPSEIWKLWIYLAAIFKANIFLILKRRKKKNQTQTRRKTPNKKKHNAHTPSSKTTAPSQPQIKKPELGWEFSRTLLAGGRARAAPTLPPQSRGGCALSANPAFCGVAL